MSKNQNKPQKTLEEARQEAIDSQRGKTVVFLAGPRPRSAAIEAHIKHLENLGCQVVVPEDINVTGVSFSHCAVDEALAVPSNPVFREPLKLTTHEDLTYYPAKGSKYHK